MKLILASSSPFRKNLLSEAGFDFEVMSPEVNEEKLKLQVDDPEQLALGLASEKAHAVKSRLSEKEAESAWIIGSDQVASCGDQLFDKPHETSKAIQTLTFLSGKTHRLQTGVCLITPNSELQHCDVTELTMRTLDKSQIERYIAADTPLNCSASYRLEKGGIKLFEMIKSDDFTAIQGLPMIWLTTALLNNGFPVI